MRAILAHDSCAQNDRADRLDNPQLDHYCRAGAQQGTRLATAIVSLVRPDSAAQARRRFMATKSTINPREFLSSHLHGGVLAERNRVSRRAAAVRPIRTVCAWCVGHDRPAAVLVDVPIDDRGLSHGICRACRSSFRSKRVAFATGKSAPVVSPH